MSKRRWCKFSRERGGHGGRSSSESDEEIPVKNYHPSRSAKDKSSFEPLLEHKKAKITSKETKEKHTERSSRSSYSSKDNKRTKIVSPEQNIASLRLKDKEMIGCAIDMNQIGPALPPHLLEKCSADVFPPSSEVEEESKNRQSLIAGTSAYHHPSGDNEMRESNIGSIGPALPPHLLKDLFTNDSCSEPSNIANTPHQVVNYDEIAGPALPPHILKRLEGNTRDEKTVIGPTIPAHILRESESPGDLAGPALPPHLVAFSSRKVIGPELPPGFAPAQSSSEDEDNGTVGPDPRLMSIGESSSAADLDERAARAKRKMLGLDKNEKKERESWMLELPPEKATIIGLGPRQFRQKLAPEMGDRTVWTDTPSDTVRKQSLPPKLDDKAIIKRKEIAERDRIMEKLAKKAEKKLKREESLLDMHAKKMKKKAKKEENEREGQPVERKRFNREEDMQVHKFDEAQKKAIFKRAQLLNDRFSQGESKYL